MKLIDSAFPEFQTSVLASKRWGDIILAPVCAILAFLGYWFLLPASLPAGVPAELTATAMGLPAEQPPFHLLWRALAELAELLPGPTLTGKLMLAQALCGALAVMLIYLVTIELIMHRLIPHGTSIDRTKVRAAQVGAVMAALAFAAAAPATLAATRASLRVLDAVILLLPVWLFLRFHNNGHVANILIAGICCGLGMGENAACLVVFGAILITGIILLWRQDRTTLPMMAFAVAAVTTMLLVYPFLCHLLNLPGGNLADLLTSLYKEVRLDYVSTRTGLLIASLGALPLILALATLQQTLNYGEEYESLLTLSVLTVGAMLVLTNLFTPFWQFAVLTPEPAVLPSLLAALTTGFAAAGWWTIALKPATPGVDIDELDLHHPGTPHVGKAIGYALALLMAGTIGLCGYRTVHMLHNRADWYPQQCAETILRNLGERRWLFGHTPVDTHLAVLAHDRQIPLRIIPLAPDNAWPAATRQKITQAIAQDAIFGELDRSQLSDALRLGPDVLLRTWLLADAQAHTKLAIADAPLRWSSCAYAPVPELFFFGGTPQPYAPSSNWADDLLSQEETRLRAEQCAMLDAATRTMLQTARQRLSASAAYAAAAYRRAGAATAANRLNELTPVPVPVSAKRQPRFSSPFAWIWELALPPGSRAQADILHTIRWTALQAAQMQFDDTTLLPTPLKTTTPLKTPIARRPTTLPEFYAQACQSADQATINQTFYWLNKLEESGAPTVPLRVLRAEANLAVTNAVAQAVTLLQKTIAQNPRDLWAWHLLVAACLQRGELTRATQELLPAMEKASPAGTNDLIRLTQALVLYARNDPAAWRAVRDRFVEVADANPDLLIAREWSLRLAMQLADDTAAARDANKLVAANPTHAQANYELATIAVRARNLTEADQRYRLSLMGATTPHALAGHARLYCLQHRYVEALQLARKATDDYPTYAEGWLALGDALEATGKIGQAAVVRSQAKALAP